jgi:hypothetical protein
MTMKKINLIVTVLMLIAIWPAAQQKKDAKAQELIQKVIKEFGGEAFLSWKDFTGSGRYFQIKSNGDQGWTKFWEYYKWSGLSRMEFDKKSEGIVEIYNTRLGKGWSYEYGKVKDKTSEEYRDFLLSEKRNITNLFRERWREPGMKVFYYSPSSLDTVKPMEALEFVDVENYSITVYFEEGSPRPVKLDYKEQIKDGPMVTKSDMFYRWFKYQEVLTPKRVEFYISGRLTGLVEYAEAAYNTGLDDKLFDEPKPAPVKKSKEKKKSEEKS